MDIIDPVLAYGANRAGQILPETAGFLYHFL